MTLRFEDLTAGGGEAGAEARGAVRLNAGPARDKARTRLLELFETVGNADPAVLTARRNLTTALF